MNSNIKSSAVNIPNATQNPKKVSFKELDSVELKEDISVDGEDGKKTLRKGEKGAVMMVYYDRNENVYEVDFPKRKVLAPVTESKLKAAFDAEW